MNIRTVGELIAELENFDRNAPVTFASGSGRTYFEYGIDQVVQVNDGQGTDVVYIAEGDQLRYLPGPVRDELGWR